MDDKEKDLFNERINAEEQEKIVKLNQNKKQPLPFGKRILSIVVSIMIIFLAANVYAATKGYNNIFFVIRKILTDEDITVTKEESKDEEQKLSETELKDALGNYATLGTIGEPEDKEIKFKKLMLVTTLIYMKENYNDVRFTKEKILKAYQELTGETFNNPEDVLEEDSFMYYDKNAKEYKYSINGTDGFIPYKVLTIKDLKYSNGIYIADIIFIAPSEGDYIDNNLENLDQYEMEIKFKLNPSYEYTKYQIVNSDEIRAKLYEKKEN